MMTSQSASPAMQTWLAAPASGASRHSAALRWLAALGCLATLAGCSGVPVSNPDTAGSGSSVSVYGTVDAGVGRTKR